MSRKNFSDNKNQLKFHVTSIQNDFVPDQIPYLENSEKIR